MPRSRASIIAVAVAFSLLAPAMPARTAGIRIDARAVCDDGPPLCSFDSIQAAIDASLPGDHVLVRPGEYDGPVDVDVARLTLCATTQTGTGCSRSTAVVRGSVTVSAAGARVRGMTLDGTVEVAAKDVLLRDNVLTGSLRLNETLRAETIDARLNDWQSSDHRALAARVEDLGTRNRVKQLPFRLDGKAEPPFPAVIGGPHSHSPANETDCENAGADYIWDAANAECRALTIDATLAYAHAGLTVVLPASRSTPPTPRFETATIDQNNLGEDLSGLTICAGAADTSFDGTQPMPSSSATCSSDPSVRAATIIDGGDNPSFGFGISGDVVLDVAADDVIIDGLTVQWSAELDTDPLTPSPAADTIGIQVGALDAAVSGNVIRMQGGGCTPEDLVTGGCYSPARTSGIRNVPNLDSAGTDITGNLIVADLVNPADGTIGGSDGIFAQATAGTVQGNILVGWGNFAATVWGSGMDVSGNAFAFNNGALKLCSSNFADPLSAHMNGILFNFEAVNVTACGPGNNLLIEQNLFDLTNESPPDQGDPTNVAKAMRILDGVHPSRIDAECNDWGVYNAVLVEQRIDDRRTAPDIVPVDFQPFRAPGGSGELSCLAPPVASFVTDVTETSRFHDVEFTNTSTPGDKPIVASTWNFGDGTMQTVPGTGDATHRYSALGAHIVTLTVTDADGMTSVASATIVINDCSTSSAANVVKLVPDDLTFCTIQDAIDAAGAGDTVLLPPDTFNESFDLNEAAVTVCRGNAGLTACAPDTGTDVVIAAQGGVAVRISANDATIDGLRISGASPVISGSNGTAKLVNPRVSRNTIQQNRGTTASLGIRLNNTSGAVMEGNTVNGHVVVGSIALDLNDPFVMTAPPGVQGNVSSTVRGNTVVGSGVGIRISDASGTSLVEGNSITIPPRGSTGADSYGISLNRGTGITSRSNTFQGAGIGLLVSSSMSARSEDDVWNGTDKGIVLRNVGTNPSGFVARGGNLAAAATALAVESAVSGVIADARLSDWGVYDDALLPGRVSNSGTDTKVLQIPFLLGDTATAEPPLPSITPAGTCTSQDTDGDTVSDVEPAGAVCRYFTVQGAVNNASASSTIAVPMSNLPSDPTPRLETVAVATNGLKLCSTTPRSSRCADAARSAVWLLQGAAFAPAPAGGSGEAVRIQTGGGQGFGVASLAMPAGTKVGDLRNLEFDAFYDDSGCGGGSPRYSFRVDADGNGSSDGEVNVYAEYATTCTDDRWIHHDLQDGVARWEATDFGGGWTMSQAAAAALFGPDHRVTTLNVIWDSPWMFAAGSTQTTWFDNIRVNDFVLMEPSNFSCTTPGGTDPNCPNGMIRSGTILDATSVAETGVRITGPDVTLDGFTVRRTAPPGMTSVQGVDISGATGPVVRRNAIRMDGGGCGPSGVAAGECTTASQANGILASMASGGAVIANNLLSGSPASSDGTVGATNAVSAVLTGASRIESNTVRGWASNGVLLPSPGSGALVTGNTFEGGADGVRACATSVRVNANTFTGHRAAVVGCQSGTGLVMRNNVMGTSNSFGVRIPSGIAGLTIDARLNDWGVYQSQLLATRILDQNPPTAGNKVLQTPFNQPS